MSSALTAAEAETERRVMIVGDLPSDVRRRVTDMLATQGIVVIAEMRAESLIDQLRHLPIDTMPLGPAAVRSPEAPWPPEPPPLTDRLLRSFEVPPLPTPAPTKPNRQQQRDARRRAKAARRRGVR